MRKMPKCLSSKRLSLLTAALVLAADQASKWWIVSCLKSTLVIAPFFNLVFVQNRGVSFGIFSNGVPPLALVFLAIAVTSALILFVCRRAVSYYRLPAAMIIGGAIGNITDRIRYGSVVDFLDFHLYQYHWPAFNIADSAVVIGVGILLLLSFSDEKTKFTKGKREG